MLREINVLIYLAGEQTKFGHCKSWLISETENEFYALEQKDNVKITCYNKNNYKYTET